MGSVSGSANLQVIAASLQSISVTPANLPMATGTTAQLTATGSYSDGSSQDLTSTTIWSSSAGGIVSVSTSGLVSALKPGSATIAATFNGVSGSTIITAANRTLQSIVVTPVNASITSGQKQQFQATANYADGTTQDVSASAHWSTSSASIATINSGQNGGGLATAKASGTVTITATLNLVSGSTTATVN
jgi:trimeric autotransporter adhesin